MSRCDHRPTYRKQMETADHSQSFGKSATLYRNAEIDPGISQKVLTDNLRSLEEDGLVDREVFAEVPPKVVYSLSELGNTLRPIINAMQEWGMDYKTRL